VGQADEKKTINQTVKKVEYMVTRDLDKQK
jgi:hypothetical protein